MTLEKELEEGLRSSARAYAPEDDAWGSVAARIAARQRRRWAFTVGIGAIAVVAVVAFLVLDGGDDLSVEVGPAGLEGTRYTAASTVLESPDHGPQLCLGVMADSYPPQCEGPDVIGWDWGAVEGEESAAGTTWGRYTVVGTWDGEALTLTEPPSPAEASDPPDRDEDPFGTPCPEPDGGWRVIDPPRSSDETLNDAIAHARSQPTVGGVWTDQSINPASLEEGKGNDPTKLILNASFTEDLERHEQAMREIWGGALCVSEASIRATKLMEIRAEVEAEVGDFLFSGIDEVAGQVEIGVPVDEGLQERFDKRYGAGVVEVQAALRPVGT